MGELQYNREEFLESLLIKHGVLCPFCGITELREDSFMNEGVECLISICDQCGIETATNSQLKINALVFKQNEMKEDFGNQQEKVEELQQKLDEYILVAETLDQLYMKEIAKNKDLKKDFGKQRLDIFILQNKIYGILGVLEEAKKSKSDNYLIKEIESVLERVIIS